MTMSAMRTAYHDDIVRLLAEHPRLVVEILRDGLGTELPDGPVTRLEDLGIRVPDDVEAVLVLVLGPPEKPGRGLDRPRRDGRDHPGRVRGRATSVSRAGRSGRSVGEGQVEGVGGEGGTGGHVLVGADQGQGVVGKVGHPQGDAQRAGLGLYGHGLRQG